ALRGHPYTIDHGAADFSNAPDFNGGAIYGRAGLAKMRVWGQVIVVGVIAAGAALAYVYRDDLPFIGSGQDVSAGAKTAGGPPPLPVESVPVRRMEITRSLEAVGTAQANEAVTITAKANGVVEKINFQEG